MSYSSEVLADSPLAYWRLGDASGTTATDSSGNGRNATYTNTPTLAATGLLTGDADTAMTVAANTGQCASIASAAWMSVSTITVEAWVNFTSSFDSGNGDGIVSHYNSGGFQFLLWRDTSNHFAVQFVNSSVTPFNVAAATTPSLNTTYHVVATLDGSNAIKLYVNGSQVASGTLSGTLAATGTVPTEIGRYSAASTTTPGATIDEVAIYGTALSAARISAHYTAGLGAPSGTGSLSLSGSGAARAATTGSGAISLSGAGAASVVASGAGSLSLSGSGSATVPVSGSGSLSLSATGDTVAPSPATGAGSLSLSGSGAAGVGVTGTGSLTLSGSGAATGSQVASGSGSLTLAGSGSATLADSGTGFLSLTATGTAQVLYVTDTSNLLNGRVRRAYATSTVDRPPAATPTRAAVKYDKAVPYPPPTLVDGRVT